MPDGYFTDASMMRVVQRERALVLSGPRAVLMQAAHPLAVSGFLAHSKATDKPYDRFARIAAAMSTIVFGSREAADEVAAHTRRAHARIAGRLTEPVGRYPKGSPYRADQPDLMLWVLFSLADTAMVFYGSYVRPMSRAHERSYWEDCKLVGELLGLGRSDLPDTLDDLDGYRREMLAGDSLRVTDWARVTVPRIVFEPPLPRIARPAAEALKSITISFLPDRIRREYRFSRRAPRSSDVAVASGALLLRRGVLPILPRRLRLNPAARLRTPSATA